MAKNSCDPIQASLDWCEGRPQYAGIRNRIYYLSRAYITNMPKIPIDDIGRPTGAQLSGDFKVKEGVVFRYIDIVAERSQATSDAQGEYPSQSSLDKLTAVHPGVGADASAAAAYMHNTNNVVIFVDSEGRARVVGIEEMWPCKATVTMDFGQGPAGTASTTINVEGTNKVPWPEYVGILPTEEGDIDFSKN